MANPLIGEVDLVADKTTYTLRLAANAVIEAETLLDKGVNEIGEMLSDRTTFRLGTARALLWAALREHHPDIDVLAAGEIISKVGIPAVVEALGRSMQLAFPDADGKSRPPKASPGGTGRSSSPAS